MKTIVSAFAVALASFGWASETHVISKQEYVQQWSPIAVQEMQKYGIPASITLAQGILESANGNSKLAVEGNNHFGIKCHDWDGKKMYKDDDAANECFRVYRSGEESFKDHSEFLKTHNRYAFLFNYSADDYKSWARGLREAGYATNSKYPDLLIGIIEDLHLDTYDKMSSGVVSAPVLAQSVQRNAHNVQTHERGVDYVVVKAGDTYYSLAQEFGLTLSQLYRFNDLGDKKDFLEPGDIVYVQAKKHGKLFSKEEIVLTKDMTIGELSQYYAVNKRTIQRLNGFTDDIQVIAKGEKVILR